MKTLILGASGRLGHRLFWEAGWRGHRVTGTRFRSANRALLRVDLRDGPATETLIRSVRPDVVLVTAGVSDALEAERHPEACYSLNRDGILAVAQGVRALFGDEDIPHPRMVCFTGGGVGSSVLSHAEAMAEEALKFVVPEQHLVVHVGRGVAESVVAEQTLDLVEGGRVGTCHLGDVETRPVRRAA